MKSPQANEALKKAREQICVVLDNIPYNYPCYEELDKMTGNIESLILEKEF